MPPDLTAEKLIACFIADPPQAVERVKTALKAAKGDREKAYASLKVSRRTFYRWLHEHPQIKAWGGDTKALKSAKKKPATKRKAAAQ